tara:strand:+ start:954 stop:1193 length:240 start_codon:yes stop_codon:yes gene_type:complete
MRLYNPTGRKTQAHIVVIKDVKYYFSYETCIAAHGKFKGKYRRIRVANSWGPTTGRHFNELGCKDFEVLEDNIFNKIIN